MRSSRVASVVALAAVGSALMAPNPAFAAGTPSASAADDEQALAERFAPVVRLVHQDEECGPGEPYRPTDVETVLGDRSVALRGPWEGDKVVTVGPTADDLGDGLYGYHLDFPGNPLEPGCDYEEWARATGADAEPTVYAHVAKEAGRDDRMALQYWFFYPYNDYTNKHEGDWEVIQLVFAASTAAEALDETPLEVGYSQHSGLEVATWDDPKLATVEGSHPVVYPAAGSHANFYESALYLGTSAEQGFGCDDTRGPSDELRPTVAVIPADPAAAVAAYPWLGYQGRWGQREASFYNGPTGPNTKDSWTRPITYQAQKARDRSYAVPAAGVLGTSATDFFCTAVSSGSEVVRKVANNPLILLLLLLLFVLLTVWLARGTTWSPVTPLRIARRRSAGQLIRAGARMYGSRWRLFIGIGFPTIPVSIVVAAAGLVMVSGRDLAGIAGGGEGGGLRVVLAATLGYLVIGTTILLVLAATTHALGEIDRGAEVGVRRAYSLALAHWRALLGAFLIMSVVVGLLSLTVVLSPVVLVLLVLAALFVPVIAFEGSSAVVSLRRSAALVRQQMVKTAVLLAVSILLAGVAGPLLGTVLILLTGAPFPVANVVAGVTYAVLMPYVGLTVAYLYFDARVRSELARPTVDAPAVLPSEI
jgi:hypothetical protein